MAEMLLVARRVERPDHNARVRFVNLRRNPDEPADAMALTRTLLHNDDSNPLSTGSELRRSEIACHHPGVDYGEVISVPQSALDGRAWPHVVFTQATLTDAALRLRDSGDLGASVTVPTTQLSNITDLGPYHMQIKGKGSAGCFDAADRPPRPLEIPALWHHNNDRETTLELPANATLHRRSDMATAQDEMLARAGRLHIATELRHAPQRLAAACTTSKMLGVRSWITLKPNNSRPGCEETLCLWLNSTPGMLLRLAHANRPYLGRSSLTHELSSTLPVLDINRLSDDQLLAGMRLFDDIKDRPLSGFADIHTDPARQELNRRLATDVLAPDNTLLAEHLEEITAALASEPLLQTRH